MRECSLSNAMFAGACGLLICQVVHGAGEQIGKLLADDASGSDGVGGSVAMTASTIIAGAAGARGTGAAYLFDAITGEQTFKLLPLDGLSNDSFGAAVKIDGTIAIVGAYRHDALGSASGAAYLFDTTTGLQTFKLLPDDGAAGDTFGRSVDVSGTTVIVGSADHDASGASAGAAYIFDAMTGLQLFKLAPPDLDIGDKFGTSVGISGTIALVTAVSDNDTGADSGSAYLFDTTTGVQLAKLVAADPGPHANFGRAGAIDGTTAVIGSRSSGGSLYVFDTTTFLQTDKIISAGDIDINTFANIIDIDGTTIVASGGGHDGFGTNAGTAYLFDTRSGLQFAQLFSDDIAAGDNFGGSVGISGDRVVAGALQNDDVGNNSGSAYLFAVTLLDLEDPTEFIADGSANCVAKGNLDPASGGGNDTTDVVIVLPDDDAVQVFLNLGDDAGMTWQGFTPQASIAVGTDPSGVATGHFNGDSFLDIAVVHAGQTDMIILVNDGTASFTPIAVSLDADPSLSHRGVGAGDFNGDGAHDIAVVNSGLDSVRVLFNALTEGPTPDFDFGPSFNTGPSPWSIEPEDVDGDRCLDMIVTNASSDTVSVVIETGGGMFDTSLQLATGAVPVDTATGDFNADGLLDIAVANSGDTTITVFHQQPGGMFDAGDTVEVGNMPVSVTTADLDEDGDLDLVVVADDANGDPALQLLEHLGDDADIEFVQIATEDVNGNPNFVISIDLDDDGLIDIVTVNDTIGGGSVSAFINAASCMSDSNEDGETNVDDLVAIIIGWGTTDFCADINNDGIVNVDDLVMVILGWGQCP